MGLNASKSKQMTYVVAIAALAAMLLGPSFITTHSASAASAPYIVTSAKTLSGSALSMWVTVAHNGSVVKTGFAPLTFYGTSGLTYTVTVSDYGSYTFDHWGNGSTSRSRTVTLGTSGVWFDAYYRTGTTSTTTITPPISGISALLPKTGIYVALYSYPNYLWQSVYDEKIKHPSVPFVVTFNPNSGPGWAKDSNFASWVAKMRSAGIIMIGYTSDNYASRSVASMNADADKYRNWYAADGLFLDEMTNKYGYEQHYRDITAYAKSVGMKMVMGNPGTDVPSTYVGTVDVINITEGSGYMSLSYLQGWHLSYDRRNFSYTRYGITWLDTAFESASAANVGLLYIHSGTDSNGRWFSLPPYFDSEVALLDR